MAKESGIANYRRGLASLLILGLLRRGDMYGYQLVKETERLTEGRITTQEGSLYPVLYKLIDAGMITDREEQSGRRMTRVYYHLEPSGEELLRTLVAEYQKITEGVFMILGDLDQSVDMETPVRRIKWILEDDNMGK